MPIHPNLASFHISFTLITCTLSFHPDLLPSFNPIFTLIVHMLPVHPNLPPFQLSSALVTHSLPFYYPNLTPFLSNATHYPCCTICHPHPLTIYCLSTVTDHPFTPTSTLITHILFYPDLPPFQPNSTPVTRTLPFHP